MCRVGKQRLREARPQAVDFLILLLAGICLGTLAKVSDETFGSLGYTYTVIAVCKFLPSSLPLPLFLLLSLSRDDFSEPALLICSILDFPDDSN